MKTKDIQELHTKTLKELKDLLAKASESLVKFKMEQATRKLKDVHQVMKKRREIARLKTIIHTKELTK
jgi:ribosomal protein L29